MYLSYVDLGITNLNESIDSKLKNKVDVALGKGLSTNDFTSDDKSKLDALTENANVDYETMLTALTQHADDTNIHLSEQQASEIALVSSKANKSYVDIELAKKADSTTLNGHIGNSVMHVTQTDKDRWNAKADVSDIPPSITVGTVKPTDSSMWYKVIG